MVRVRLAFFVVRGRSTRQWRVLYGRLAKKADPPSEIVGRKRELFCCIANAIANARQEGTKNILTVVVEDYSGRTRTITTVVVVVGCDDCQSHRRSHRVAMSRLFLDSQSLCVCVCVCLYC